MVWLCCLSRQQAAGGKARQGMRGLHPVTDTGKRKFHGWFCMFLLEQLCQRQGDGSKGDLKA